MFYDIKLTGNPEDTASTADLPSLTTTVLEPAYALGARVFSNSWTLDDLSYHAISRELDLFINNNLDVLMLFSVGNNGEAGGESHLSLPSCSAYMFAELTPAFPFCARNEQNRESTPRPRQRMWWALEPPTTRRTRTLRRSRPGVSPSPV